MYKIIKKRMRKKETMEGAKRVKKAFNAVAVCSPADRIFFVSVWHLKKRKEAEKWGIYIFYIYINTVFG